MKQTTNEAGKCSNDRFPTFGENIHSIKDALQDHDSASIVLGLLILTFSPVLLILGVLILPFVPAELSQFLLSAYLVFLGWCVVTALFFLKSISPDPSAERDTLDQKSVNFIVEWLFCLAGYPAWAIFLALFVCALPITLLVDVVRNIYCVVRHRP